MPRGVPCEFTPFEQDVISMAVEMGWAKRRIATYLGKPEANIRRFLRRVEAVPNPEECEIVTPLHLTPESPPTPIHPGDAAYCVVSHLTGIEDHPKLRRPPKRTRQKKDPAKFRPKGAKATT